MDKLELKHLACYLPYGLKLKTDQYVCKFLTDGQIFSYDKIKCEHYFHPINGTKYTFPILRPLSDLTKHITHDGQTLVPSESLAREFQMNVIEFNLLVQNLENTEFILRTASFAVVQRLIEYHFDVFGLIPAGLAISYKEVGL